MGCLCDLYHYYLIINMSSIHPVPDNGGAAFFGFMGVSLALVLASTTLSI